VSLTGMCYLRCAFTGGESVRIALYVFHQGQIPLKNENEVIIDKFEYLP